MLVVDRIVCGLVVCERPDRTSVILFQEELPEGVGEGDCLCQLPDGSFVVDAEETSRRRKSNFDLFRSLLMDEE